MRTPAEIVDSIRAMCKAKGTTVQNLEQELSLGNGSIGKWAKGKRYPPANRLQIIANYFGVSVGEFTGEADQKEKPTAESGEPGAESIRLLLSKMSVSDLQNLMGDIAAEMAGRAKG